MTTLPIVKLASGKEVSARHRHPWIFSGALAEKPADLANGALVTVAAASGQPLGVGTYSKHSSIAVRLLSFGEAVIDEAWLRGRLRRAAEVRALHGYAPGGATSGYRLVFGEADGLPGLVVDRYEDVLVLQISTAGMDLLKPLIVNALAAEFQPRCIFERSDLAVRKEEQLPDVAGPLQGEDPGLVEFQENGWRFLADVAHGQKTGYFLDQKDLRLAVSSFAAGRKTLNLFSYTGAGSIAALKGGAASVLNVDGSAAALELCPRQAELNGLKTADISSETADVFQYLATKTEPEFDMVLLDPPALIKSRKDAEEGKKAYHFLNRAALRLVRDGGILATSSCSHFLSEEDLLFVLRRASIQAGVELSVLASIRQSADHPRSVYFPENDYLKSFICLVRRTG
ncbi:MAG: class I SAM-dependent rRNA methyltransferase [Patescibacteria group bacterium]|jgi:23S rRNA (cytosine1962-C5)-methyltransferase